MYCSEEIKSFWEIDSHAFARDKEEKIKNEIENNSKDYILNIDENEYLTYLKEKYCLNPLEIDKTSEHIGKPAIEKETRVDKYCMNRAYEEDVYFIRISYAYTGSKEIFYIRPSTCTVTTYRICVSQSNIVSFVVRLIEKDAKIFKREKESAFDNAFTNIENANNFANDWNDRLDGLIKNIFDTIKTKYIEEYNFFTAINAQIDEKTSKVFSVPYSSKN